ncbi:disease resistance protein RGA2-like, partial [Triticum urartu]
ALRDAIAGFMHGADGASTGGDVDMSTTSSSSGKQRRRRFEVSKHLDHFITGEVKETHMDQPEHASHHQLPNPSSIGDAIANATLVALGVPSSRKRMRTDQDPGDSFTPDVHAWNKEEFSSRIQDITRQLQDIRGDVTRVLNILGSESGAGPSDYQSTASDPRLRTSSLLKGRVYGRVEEKNYIKNLMTDEEYGSVGVTVLPIVGIAGVGKTTLAQLVYNDPDVQSQFKNRIWVRVSNNFDEIRVSRDMLDFASPSEKPHEGVCSFAKLQEVLKSHIRLKRVLLVLDDVWDDMSDCRWNQLLAPFKSNNARGNMILVTTRNMSVAKRIGTTGPIRLHALGNDDIWLLFKACAFGDENYAGHRSLSIIGKQIADKLKGNPLAAVTAGALLREKLTIDHWGNILRNEDWKLLGLNGGIMSALKLSYDQLPYHLHQCFSYCSIFPDNYQFLGEELVQIWISQGFVKHRHSNKILEKMGMDYLDDLLNLGYFHQVGRQNSSQGSQNCYAMCGLMRDFVRMVSRTECAITNDLQCNDILPTVRHLSVVTGYAYNKNQVGNKHCSNNFEENLRNKVTSLRKLRTLVLIGQFDSSMLQSFQDILREAHNLRLLQISGTSADYNSLMCSLVNPTHLRYLKLKVDEVHEGLPQVWSKFCHLQVLDVASNIDSNVIYGMSNVPSLRHLVSKEGVHSSIAGIGELISLQELHNFSVQDSNGVDIIELQSMNELVRLGISQLQNVKTREEAYQARLRDKHQLEKLHLSWNGTSSHDEYDHGMSSEMEVPLLVEVLEGPETCTSVEMEECLPKQVTEGLQTSSSMVMDCLQIDVLEGLEPNSNLKHLQISGYNGALSPFWLASNTPVTSLQTLHLENCGEWRILPSLGSLLFLTKLKLSSMQKVVEVFVPSLEELVLIKMPKLERCLCISKRDLNSSLRVLKIKWCPVLEVFDLFGNGQELKIEEPWLPGLRKLIVHDCPHLLIPHCLPSSSTFRIFNRKVSKFARIQGWSSERLTICILHKNFEESSSDEDFSEFCGEQLVLDGNIMAPHNLLFLTRLKIEGCQDLLSVSFKGLRKLVSLKTLKIRNCGKLFSPAILREHVNEDVTVANYGALPSLQCLSIKSCGITGKWLSLILKHALVPEELILQDCPEITRLSIEPEENNVSNVISAPNASTLTSSAQDRLLCIPLNLVSSLKKISICECPDLAFCGNNEGFAEFTSLEMLTINYGCDMLLSSLVHEDGRWLLPKSLVELDVNEDSEETLEPSFVGNATCLKVLDVWGSSSLEYLKLHHCTALEKLTVRDCELLDKLEGLPSLTKLEVEYISSLESLQLHSCTALEELNILSCASLSTLEGFSSLGSLRHLKIHDCLCLHPCLEGLPGQGYQPFPRLESLDIDDFSILTTSFFKHQTSLQSLKLRTRDVGVTRLTDEQERELLRLESLQTLKFEASEYLKYLPAGLHSHPSLERLEVYRCPRISRLPAMGLPPSLENLHIMFCSEELNDGCRMLRTSNLNVSINYQNVE